MTRAMGGIVVLALAAASVACEEDGTNVEVPDVFDARLSGDEEVEPVETEAHGAAVFSWDGTTMSYVITAVDIQDVTAAHIHEGEAGENGGILVTLYDGPVIEGDSVLVEDEFSEPDEGVDLTMDELLELMRTGGVYVNVHTEENPGGEIRGQVEQSLD